MYEQTEDKELIEFVFKNCLDNLNWLKCEIKDFNVFIISEGVFLCRIDNQNIEYQNIVLRLDKLNPLKNTLITSPKAVELISCYELNRNNLGPKLLSIFKNGRIEEWINGMPIGNQFHHDKQIRKQIAECIAKIHKINNVKAERNGNFLINKSNIFLKLIHTNKSNYGYSILLDFINKNLNNQNKDKISLEDELIFLDNNLNKLNCLNQLVFSHNDLNNESIFKRLNDNQIYVLNLDLVGYHYRGYDLAHYLNNIAFNFDDLPTNVNQLNYLNNEELKDFLNYYINETNKSINLDNLIKEVNFFKIYSSYLSMLVTVLTILSNNQIESNLDFLKLRIDYYLNLKDEYLRSN